MTKKQIISGIPYSIALIYMLVSSAYILYSDRLVMAMAGADKERIQMIQTEKGIVFVLLSGVILLLVIRRSMMVAQNYETAMYAQERQKQQLVADSELKYITLFNTIPQPIWVFDEETLAILQVNDAACTMYGYTHAEYDKMTLHDLRPPSEIPILERILAAIRGHERNKIPYPIKHLRKDGSTIYVRIENVQVVLNGRKARLAIGTDVTEDLKLKQELTLWYERLKAAHALSGMGYWTRKMDTNEIYWSDELYEMFGVTPETFELTEENITRALSNNREQPIAFNPNVWNDVDQIDLERMVMLQDGSTKWIQERIHAHRDADNNITMLEGIVMDITKRKEYEQHISESNERLRMVMRATVEAIIDWDIAGNKVYLSSGFSQYFGYNEYENNYRLWADNICSEDRDQLFAALYQRLNDPTAEEISSEYRFRKADGTVAWVAHKGICLRDAHGKATRVVSAMIDITQQREYVQQIEQQNDALRQIAFMQSHVVRAPLATLMGLVTLLQQGAATTEEAEMYMNAIQESANKLDAIVHEIVKNTEAAESQLTARSHADTPRQKEV
jgi:PAS domain S-box-containing protein